MDGCMCIPSVLPVVATFLQLAPDEICQIQQAARSIPVYMCTYYVCLAPCRSGSPEFPITPSG